MKRLVTAAVALLLVAGCGKSSTSPSGNKLSAGSPGGSIPCTGGIVGSPGVATGTLTAQINGSNWKADCFGVLVAGATVSVTGVDLQGTSQILGFGAPKAIGSNSVGFGSVVTGHLGLVNTSGNTSSWGAQLNTGSGTVQITALTSTSIAGTFNFVMPPQTGSGATGTKTITNGVFNLTF